MHPEHAALLEALRSAARPASGGFDAQRYHGSEHGFLNVPLPERRRIARAWVKAHRSATPQQVLAVADSLVKGSSHEEKTLAAILLGTCRPAREAVVPARVEAWLEHLVGWAEVDNLCQNLFPPEQLLADWPAWRALIEALAGDPNINKRRAALVLLTGPVHRSDDERLSALAFQTIERLKGEKAIIITKAISWLLRCLASRHRDEVAAYLDREGAGLPAIAVRETRTKLATGKKT
jgi:3-methyladenine DNA glycosylase AlkD